MSISRISGFNSCHPSANADTYVAERKPLSIKRLEAWLNKQETAYERLHRIRNQVRLSPGVESRFDQLFSDPQRFTNPVLRSLVYVGQYLEELAEACADISGVTERLTRNLISGGEKSDLPMVISSAVGRVISGQFNLLGIAMHKAAGACLYGLSTVASGLALLICLKPAWAAQRTEEEYRAAADNSRIGESLGLSLSREILNSKESLISKALDSSNRHAFPCRQKARKLLKYLSSRHTSDHSSRAWSRKRNASYIWNNLHQYGLVTRSLMRLAHGLFQTINRLSVSIDKHTGTWIGRKILKPCTGEILGCRLGMMLSVGAAAAISIPLSPYLVGIWTVGAAACGVALLAIILAKINVEVSGDWKGDISKPRKLRF